MTANLMATSTDAVDPERWPDVASVPGGPLGPPSARIAWWLLRRAAQKLPLRVAYPDGTVVGAPDPHLPTLVVRQPGSLARRIGRRGLIGFGEASPANGNPTTSSGC